MKHQSTVLGSEFTAAHNSNSNEIVERLAVLSGQHIALTEKLRELHDQTSQQAGVQFKWQDLKNQVINLRFELESFKRVF